MQRTGIARRLFILLMVAAMLVPMAVLAQSGSATAKGFGGEVEVKLVVADGVITELTAAGDDETPGVGTMALEQLPDKILASNSLDVDLVAGASVTSKAVLEAAAAALEAAGIVEGDLVKKESAQDDQPAKAVPAFDNPDVIVVGAGFAGVNAAIEAAQQGARVYLFEQNTAIGGSVRFAGGTSSAAGAKMQKDAGVEDSPENFAQDILRMGGGTNIPELTKTHTEHAAAAIDWLDELGVDFGDRQPKMSGSYDAFNVPREYRAQGGVKFIEAVAPLLNQQVEDGQVSLMLETRVDGLVIEDGAVKGVILYDAEKTQYRAPAVILATGGYGHNEELINRYNFAHVLTMSPPFCTGDGFVFAEQAGAAFRNMDYLPAYPGGVPVDGFDVSCTAVVSGLPSVVWVDKNGKRIVNEFDGLDSQRKQAYADAPENLVFMLLTEEVKTAAERPLLKVGGGFSGKPDEGWDYFGQLAADENCVFKGDTLEEAAQKAGVDAKGLEETLKAYNLAVEAGEDKDFGRPAESMTKLENGPFYLVKTYPYVMLTKGGPVMNSQAQVINQAGEPIPGLYQCGELVGGANIGGSANTICVVWGKIAGSNAAEYALKTK